MSEVVAIVVDHYARGPGPGGVLGHRLGGRLNASVVVAILEERGLDPSKEFPKPLTDALGREADIDRRVRSLLGELL